MATMRSFGTFAPKPDVAGALQRSQQIANQAAAAAASLQMQRAQIQQRREIANMEAQMRMRQQNQDNLIRQQAMKIDQDYKNQTLGLQERKLELAEGQMMQQAQDVARQFQAQQALAQELTQIQGNTELTDVQRDTMQRNALLRHGAMGATVLGAGGILGSGGAAGGRNEMMDLPTEMRPLTMPDGTESGAYAVRTSRTGQQLWQPPDPEKKDDTLTRQLFMQQIDSTDRELRELRQDIRAGEMSYQRAFEKPEKKRSDREKLLIKTYESDKSRAEELEKELNKLRSSALSGGQQRQQQTNQNDPLGLFQ